MHREHPAITVPTNAAPSYLVAAQRLARSSHSAFLKFDSSEAVLARPPEGMEQRDQSRVLGARVSYLPVHRLAKPIQRFRMTPKAHQERG
jgi:hypothetical protein